VLQERGEYFRSRSRRLATPAAQALGDELGDLRCEEVGPSGTGDERRESIREEQEGVGLSQLLVVK